MILPNVAFQVCPVPCFLLLVALLQGFIVRAEGRIQRSRGPNILLPFRDLWKILSPHNYV